MLDFFNAYANTIAFITILLLTVLALVGSFKKEGRLVKYAKQSPAMLTTVGVFFSFVGILIGLNYFDVKNPESISHLLDGLKIKFASSLMGIGASILVKFVQSFKLDDEVLDSDQEIINLLKDIKQSLSENKQNSPEQLFAELKKSIDVLPQEFKKQSGLLGDIKSSLAGEGDASVTTQLLKVREAFRDGLDNQDKRNKQYFYELNNNNKQYLGIVNKSIKDGFENQNNIFNKNFDNLTQKFEDFADILAKNNTEIFIKALSDAMQEFNKNLTDQFGENFKELNRAVGELLKWQDNYKLHVENLTANFETALKSVEIIKSSFREIENRSQNFTNTSEKLHGILESLDRQLKDLDSYLKSFDTLANNANNAFPIIRDNLNDLTIGFKESTKQSLTEINNTVIDMRSNLTHATDRLKDTSITFDGMAIKIKQSIDIQEKTLTGASQDFKATIDKALRDLYEQSKTTIENHERELQRVVQEQMNHISNAIKSSSEQFNKLLIDNTTKSTSVLEQQTKLLDTALQEELKKSIERMGTLLARLSDKFVSDYTPLTEKLREVVRLADDLKRGR